MKVTAIICEYNPFHNGHKYHIEETRRICSSDYIVGIMSGPFTQRGTPAIVNKYRRTEMALNNGCDVIIELPVRYAVSSAEGFCQGAVNTLSEMGIVNNICFGSEAGTLSELMNISDIISEEPDVYRNVLQTSLKDGMSFPVARNMALMSYMESRGKSFDIDISQPNTILALEYLRACKNTGIEACTIKRTDAGYHSTSLGDSHKDMCSASAVRHFLQNGADPENSNDAENIDTYIPYKAEDYLSNPLYENDFSMQLYMSLISNINNLEEFLDMPVDLALRIRNNITNYENWNQFMTLLKTKQYTYTRIQRALCHCMLGLKKNADNNSNNNVKNNRENYRAPYIRVLGFKKSSSALMKALGKIAAVPVITKPRDVHTMSDSFARNMLMEDITASEIYETTYSYIHGKAKSYSEFTRGLVIAE